MLGSLDFVLKMMGNHLKILGKGPVRASQGLKITLAAAWSLGLKVGESKQPRMPETDVYLRDICWGWALWLMTVIPALLETEAG